MKKKVLLVGSSFSAAPLLFTLKKYGFNVATCGNIPSDPCHQLADAVFLMDYSNKNDLLELVRAEKFDYIVPSCNDYAYMSCAWVAENLHYPGFDSFEKTRILHTKDAFREFAQREGFPVPAFLKIAQGESIASHGLLFPLLVKPVDSFSGRGVTKINASQELPTAIDAAIRSSRSNQAVVEEFVDGTLHSHSAFIQNGAIVFDVFVDEYCTVYPYQVNCSNHPSFLSERTKKKVQRCMSALIDALNLSNGLLHTQFIANGDNFWIIECMRRCPGDLYGRLIELSTHISYTDYYTRPFIGKELSHNVVNKRFLSYGRHTISTDRVTTSYSFSHNLSCDNVDVVPLKNSGEILNAAPFDKLAILFAKYTSKRQMLAITPKLANHVSIRSLEDIYFDNQNSQ